MTSHIRYFATKMLRLTLPTDCHARVGGATGTDLTPKECPPSKSGIDEGCNAASLMMHITSKASGYFENMWLWVADHMIELVFLCLAPQRLAY